jgi:hypothetical protein
MANRDDRRLLLQVLLELTVAAAQIPSRTLAHIVIWAAAERRKQL